MVAGVQSYIKEYDFRLLSQCRPSLRLQMTEKIYYMGKD